MLRYKELRAGTYTQTLCQVNSYANVGLGLLQGLLKLKKQPVSSSFNESFEDTSPSIGDWH